MDIVSEHLVSLVARQVEGDCPASGTIQVRHRLGTLRTDGLHMRTVAKRCAVGSCARVAGR